MEAGTGVALTRIKLLPEFGRRLPIFTLLVVGYSVVHVLFEYNFWFTESQDIFGKYAAAAQGLSDLAIAKRVYYAKATWMFALVWLQVLRVPLATALALSFLLYSLELVVFFPLQMYSVLNLALAVGCVVEQLAHRRRAKTDL